MTLFSDYNHAEIRRITVNVSNEVGTFTYDDRHYVPTRLHVRYARDTVFHNWAVSKVSILAHELDASPDDLRMFDKCYSDWLPEWAQTFVAAHLAAITQANPPHQPTKRPA